MNMNNSGSNDMQRMGISYGIKTAGGQGEGKKQISEYRPAKGYYDGIAQGKRTLARELSHIMEKHLTVGLKPEKCGNKVSEKQLEKFNRLLDEKSYME